MLGPDERAKTRSLSGPSLNIARASRSTSTYRSGFVTIAVTNNVWPVRRFSSPKKPDGPRRKISRSGFVDVRDLAVDRDKRGWVRSPARQSTSPTRAVRSSSDATSRANAMARARDSREQRPNRAYPDAFVPPSLHPCSSTATTVSTGARPSGSVVKRQSAVASRRSGPGPGRWRPGPSSRVSASTASRRRRRTRPEVERVQRLVRRRVVARQCWASAGGSRGPSEAPRRRHRRHDPHPALTAAAVAGCPSRCPRRIPRKRLSQASRTSRRRISTHKEVDAGYRARLSMSWTCRSSASS